MADLGKVSLVLCVKNGGDRLQKCLTGIERQDWTGLFEVLLVDNGSTDGITYKRMLLFAAASKHSVRVFQTAVPGNAAGRNLAIGRATGGLVLFIDGDCYAEPGFVRKWFETFSDPSVGYGTGRILRFDPAQSMVGCCEDSQTYMLAGGSFVPRGFIQGSNMAFRLTCLRDAGPFDERFGAGTSFAGEEWDVALRGSVAGWAGGYFPEPTVWHDHRRSEADARAMTLYYDYGGGAVYAKTLFAGGGLRAIKALLYDVYNSNSLVRATRFVRGMFDYIVKADLRNT